MKTSQKNATIVAQTTELVETIYSKGYNTERLNSLLYCWEPEYIAENLLKIHFDFVNLMCSANNDSGEYQFAGDALCTLKDVYEAFAKMKSHETEQSTPIVVYRDNPKDAEVIADLRKAVDVGDDVIALKNATIKDLKTLISDHQEHIKILKSQLSSTN